MALTTWRWLAAAIAGFLLVPVLVLRDADDDTPVQRERDRLVERQRSATRELAWAVNRLRLQRLHDSILARAPGAGSLWYGMDAAIDPATRALLDTVARAAALNRATSARVPAQLHFVLDTVRAVDGHARATGSIGALAVDYLLPNDSLHRCVVVARVRLSQRANHGAELRSEITRERLHGPCAYVERFGLPGRGIAEWLDRRGWQFAQRADWSAPSRQRLADLGTRPVSLDWSMNHLGRGCAGGKDSSCVLAVLAPDVHERWRASLRKTNGVLTTGYFNPFLHGDNSWITHDWPLGSREWTLLSDMVSSIGAERFEQFWTSDLAPTAAFEQATGIPLAQWTRDWLEDTYGPHQTGPALPAGASGFGALILIGGAVLAAIAAKRRTAG